MKVKKALIAITAIAVVMNSSFLSFGADVMAKAETPVITASAAKAVPDEAATGPSNDNQTILTDAVTLVRTRIDIPEEYEDFTGSVSKTRGVDVSNLVWKSKTSDNSVRVTVTGKLITSYYKYKEWDDTPSFAPFTKEEYVSKALSFIEQANPTMKDKLETDSYYITLTGSNVNISFRRVQNGLNVDSNNVRISLDKKTGEVVEMNTGWWRNAEFKGTDNILTQEKIKSIYMADVKLTPHYKISDKTNKKGQRIAQPVYMPNKPFVYDAVTGRASTINEDKSKYLNTDLYGSDDYEEDMVEEECLDVPAGEGLGGRSYKMTEAEEKQVKELEDALTAEEFKAQLKKDPYIMLDDSFIVDDFRIDRDESYESGYRISFDAHVNNKNSYRWLNVNADAKSGDIHSFWQTKGKDSKEPINVKKANKTANAAKKYYCPSISSRYREVEENTAPAVQTSKYTESERTFKFERYENNIVVDNQTISVTVDNTGFITNFSVDHDPNVDFGNGKILSKTAALKKYLEANDLELKYQGFTDLKSVPHTYLNYTADKWTISAITGKTVDSYGNETVNSDDTNACPYTDISGSAYKNEIAKLCEYGVIYYKGDKLDPKKAITYKEFVELCHTAGFCGIWMSDNEEDRELTRLELAECFVRTAGLENAIGLKGIYKQVFKDVKTSDKNASTAALAYALGAVAPDKNGNFNATGKVTREEAYHAIYSYIDHQ
ncbi:MAG: S-layer homology domain-containing protein [Oscillospiraceae bacterium]|nr:S-layer homology domain-containing protein [Oscillospiraceae bacterium]